MSFGTGWLNEAENAYGEALSLRVYLRNPVEYGNYYSYLEQRVSLNGGQLNRDIDGYTSPTGYEVESFSGYYSTASPIAVPEWLYVAPELPTVSGDSVTYSVYVSTASTIATGPSFGAVIGMYISDSGGTRSKSFYYGFDHSYTGWSVAASGGSGVNFSGGVEALTGYPGWSRVWVTYATSGTETGFIVRMVPDHDSDSNGELIFSSPQLEVQTGSPRPHVYVDGTAYEDGVGELEALSDDASVIQLNPIRIERERDFGVIQGQNTQITISNADFRHESYDLPGSWVAVQAGFVNAGYWETVAQGRINNASWDTSLGLILELDDGVMQVINSSISRDMYLTGGNGWIGEVKKQSVDEESKSYQGYYTASTVVSGTSVFGEIRTDERFDLVFQSDTTFQVQRENGEWVYEYFSGDGTNVILCGTPVVFEISGNCRLSSTSQLSAHTVTIYSGGWFSSVEYSTGNTAAATGYTSGDIFEVFVSKPRTDRQLTPVGMAQHLIEDVAGLQVYDVSNGAFYSSPLSNVDNWIALTTSSLQAGRKIGGYWKAGSKIVEMIQDAMKLELGSVYPTPTGQIAAYMPFGASSATTIINGAPGADAVTLLNATVQDSLDYLANSVTINYLDLSTGEEKSYTTTETIRRLQARSKEIDTKWRVKDTTATAAANRALTRFKEPRRVYTLGTTLATAGVEVTEAAALTDPFLNLYGVKFDITSKEFDILGQQITLEGWTDELAQVDIAKVDGNDPSVNDPESRVSDGTTVWLNRKVW